jgi:uncharacterized protein (TIGR02996 family)
MPTRKKTPARSNSVETERRAFLAAIVAAPDDDTPRLVFADWLDEHGEHDRAEYIRLECQSARLEDDDPQRAIVDKRSAALLRKHLQKWELEAPLWARKGLSFKRGFIDHIVTSAASWIKRADKLLAGVPITSVRFENVRDRFSELLAVPSLAQIRRLTFSWNSLSDSQVAALAAVRTLSGLRALELFLSRVSDAGVKSLADSSYFAGLVSLNLMDNWISGAGAEALAKTRHLLRLTNLEMSANAIGDQGVTALAGSPVLANVCRLYLYANDIGDEGAETLASSAHVASLRELSLGDNSIGDGGCTALANSPQLAGLKKLYLHDNPIGDEGGRALAESPFLKDVVDLTLDGDRLRSKTKKAIKKRFGKRVRL